MRGAGTSSPVWKKLGVSSVSIDQLRSSRKVSDAGSFHEGPLVRVGPNLLVCNDPDELRKISGIRSRYTKGPAYEASRITDGDHIVSQRDPAKHKALRAKMGPAVSPVLVSRASDMVLGSPDADDTDSIRLTCNQV